MRTGLLVALLVAAAAAVPARAADVLHDNGIETDGVHATPVARPWEPRVRIVDDIVVPPGSVWVVTGFRYALNVDDHVAIGPRTEICVWSDTGGRGPREEIYDAAHPHAYRLVGRHFRRPTYEVTVRDMLLVLPPGTYWIGPMLPDATGGGLAGWITSSVDDVRRHGDLAWWSPNAGAAWCRHDVMGWDGDYWHQAFQVLGFELAVPNPGAGGPETAPSPAGAREPARPAVPARAAARTREAEPPPSAGIELLWDNDLQPNGFMARAISPPVFPDIRVADDFVVPGNETWTITSFHLNVVEDAGWEPGPILQYYLHEDSGGAGPGQRMLFEGGPFDRVFTGQQLFDRDVYDYWSEAVDIELPFGRYWVGFRNGQAGGAGTNYWNSSDGGQGENTTGYFSLDAGETWLAEGAGWDHAFEVRGVRTALDPVPPISFEIVRGAYADGGLLSLVESDDDRLVIAARRPSKVSQPSVQVIVEGRIPPGDVQLLQFLSEASISISTEVVRWTDLYNFAEGRWVRFDTRPSTFVDSVVIAREDERPGDYVDADGRVRARLSFYDPGIPIAGWFGRFDRTIWHVSE